MDPNSRIGDYEILDELGRGGMGRVYRVRNVISDRIEAMKILLPDLVGRQDLAERFLREIKLLAAMNHPNIASLRTALTVDNQLIMIMEYVEGQSLAGRLRQGPIAIGDALSYLDQVLGALHYAHERDVIHRDIKPANMMLTPQGVVKLMDFGIARSGGESVLTVVGSTTGSLGYMSPEQVQCGPVDARSDLYSLGISFYEVVTGVRPFQSNSDYAVMLAHLNDTPKPPATVQQGLSAEVNDIIMKAIAKDPAQRFQSANAFRDALNNVRLGSAPAATNRHDVGMVGSAVSAALLEEASSAPPAQSVSEASMNKNPSEDSRTIAYPRTPSGPDFQTPHPNLTAAPGMQPPPPRPIHPGVYMTLGAFLLVAALVGLSLYPGKAAAGPRAGEQRTEPVAAEKTSVPPVVPQSSSDSSTVAPGAGTDALDARAQPLVPAAGAAKATLERSGPSGPTSVGRTPLRDAAPAKRGPAAASTQTRAAKPEPTSQEAGKPTADLDQLEHEIGELSTRVAAVNSSLSRLQQGQARQGLGLRGDIAARWESLRLNLSRADEAIGQRNAARALRYKGLTEGDAEVLERFLGR